MVIGSSVSAGHSQLAPLFLEINILVDIINLLLFAKHEKYLLNYCFWVTSLTLLIASYQHGLKQFNISL